MAAPSILIPEASLVDWLTDRNFLKKQWRQKLQALQVKAAEAAKSLPQSLQLDLDLSKGISYQAARAVEARLQDAEQRAQLGCGRGDHSVWLKIVRAYEKENLHLGEAALALVRNSEFEIPFHRNRVAKQQQQLVDLEKKEGEYRKSVFDSQKAYLQECQAIGIAGDDIEKELRQVAAGLPAAVEEAAAQLQNPALQQAVDHYKSFCAFTAPSSDGAAASVPLISALSPDTLRLHLPAGQSVGDDRIDPDERTIGDSHSPDDEAQIDWGVDEAAAATPADTVTNDANRMAVDWHTTIENTRGAVVTELSELRAFFHLRSSELGSATYAAILPSTPEAVQQTDSKAIQDMLSVVTDCMDTYTSDKLKTLIALAHSKRYFGRTVAGLQRQASQQSKFYRLQKEVEAKRQELQAELVAEAASLNSLISASSQLRTLTERQLEALVKAPLQLTGGASSA